MFYYVKSTESTVPLGEKLYNASLSWRDSPLNEVVMAHI